MNTLWRFFSSVRLTVTVLLTLAVTSVFGTLIPQNQNPADYRAAFGDTVYRLLKIFDVFNLYYSWWFQLLLLVLVLNIIVCSLDRFPLAWKIIHGGRRRPIRPNRFPKRRSDVLLKSARPVDDLMPGVADLMKKRFGFARSDTEAEAPMVYSESGRWARLGVYAVHLSVVLLLVGALIGSQFGFDGHVNIAEGQTVDSIRLRNSNRTLRLPFSIRCNDFNVTFYDSGSPKEYRSDLTLLRDGREVFRKSIVVNDPIRYQGINLFQASYQPIPGKRAVFEFVSTATGKSYRHTLGIGDSVELAENLGTFTLERLERQAQFRGTPIGEAFVGRLTGADGVSREVTLPPRFPSFDRMRKGRVVVSAIEQETAYMTGLQVTRDPGVWVVYSGFIMIIVGCWVTFFMGHRQVLVVLTPTATGTQVRITGTTTRNRYGLDRQMAHLGEIIGAM